MQEKWIKILCGKLYTGLKAEFLEHAEILIHGKYIEDIGFHLDCPEGTEILDLSRLTVTPGMIDAHMHPEYFNWRDVYSDTIYNSDGYRALATYCTAERALHGGFTTIRSMGWFRESYELDVKRAINEGYLPGARMIVAPHLLGTTGSHADMTQTVRTNPILCDFMEKLSTGIGNGPDFFTAAVRREKKLGADFIKIMATGGFATPNDDPDDIQMNDAEFKAIFDTARELKISVTAHAYGPRLMKKLIGYGITGIEHGSLMDEETAGLFEQTGTYLVATFSPFHEAIYPNPEKMAQKSPAFQKKLGIYQERMKRAREIIVGSRIKLGYGTDFVAAYQNYESGMEYRCMMESGIEPFRILEAATKTNAEICEIDSFTGTLEKGKYADLSGWARDLLTDKDALRDCSFVMKEGVVYEAKSYIEEQ